MDEAFHLKIIAHSIMQDWTTINNALEISRNACFFFNVRVNFNIWKRGEKIVMIHPAPRGVCAARVLFAININICSVRDVRYTECGCLLLK